VSVSSSTADRGRRRPYHRVAPILAALLALAGCANVRRAGVPVETLPPGSTANGFAPGEPGLGDPYYPRSGNGGYDVGSYDLAVSYDPGDDTLTGTAVISATATAGLSRFNLDLRGLTVRSVTVDDAPASHTRAGGELAVTPAAGIPAGARFEVEVRYDGVARPYGEAGLDALGFLHTDDGAMAIGEPFSAATWFPVNDHPRDKATYRIAVTAPGNLAALSNGVLEGKRPAGGRTTWTWVVDSPMAPYLATVVIGRYRVTQREHAGRPVVLAVDVDLPTTVDREIGRTPEVVDFLAGYFGPYPFDAMGGIVIDEPRISFALENQTRPIYSRGFFDGPAGSGTWVIVHELAHQWFGDSVSVHDWSEIWLNEGFASYAEWLWGEENAGETAQARFDRGYGPPNRSDRRFWRVPPGDPGASRLFDPAVYERGAMTLHALRMTVGDRAFFEILKTWPRERAHATATTEQFIAVAERISGQQLDALFQAWLYESGRPPRP
jgi:aminopeptidase N